VGEGERGKGVGDSPGGVTKGGGGFRQAGCFRTMVGASNDGGGCFCEGQGWLTRCLRC
jgi:hypothetical protein